jgi:hypothetical protein
MLTKKYAGQNKRIDLLAAAITALTRLDPLIQISRIKQDIGV